MCKAIQLQHNSVKLQLDVNFSENSISYYVMLIEKYHNSKNNFQNCMWLGQFIIGKLDGLGWGWSEI